MDLPSAGEIILLFITDNIDEASLALPCSTKWTLSLNYKFSLV